MLTRNELTAVRALINQTIDEMEEIRDYDTSLLLQARESIDEILSQAETFEARKAFHCNSCINKVKVVVLEGTYIFNSKTHRICYHECPECTELYFVLEEKGTLSLWEETMQKVEYNYTPSEQIMLNQYDLTGR